MWFYQSRSSSSSDATVLSSWRHCSQSTFTSQAAEEAIRDGAIAIDLIDGDRLCDLLKENTLGVEIEIIERVRIRSDWFKGI